MKLTEKEKKEALIEVESILKNYEQDSENLIPILQQVQKNLGYVPGPAMVAISEAMDVPAVDIYSLVTFYNQFRLNPPGEHQIKVCMGTACYMVGGKIALDSFERRLEIKEDETTPDRKFSLERVACVGCCTMAPVVMVNDEMESKVTPTRVDGLLSACDPKYAYKSEKNDTERGDAK